MRIESLFKNFPKLKQVNIDGGRYYLLDDNPTKFYSVTTLIGKSCRPTPPGKKKFGGNKAALRGTQHHLLVEDHIKGIPVNPPDQLDLFGPTEEEIAFRRFAAVRDCIDEHVSTVHGLEQRLYSTELLAGGTMDLLCIWDGKLFIVDQKTTRHKNNFKAAWLFSYFVQQVAYKIMVREHMELDPDLMLLYSLENGEVRPKYLPCTEDDVESVKQMFRTLRQNSV